MLRIVLIRPGSTDFDQQGRIQGTIDLPLDEQGTLEAGRLVDELAELPVEVVYAAPCAAAQQTAQTLADARGWRLKTLDQLQNLDHGLWQGMLIEDLRRKYPRVYRQWQEQPESVCPPEGETLGEAEERARAALVKLLRKHRDAAIALVAPEPMASIVRGLVKQESLGDLWKAGDEHGRWELLEVLPENVLSSTDC